MTKVITKTAITIVISKDCAVPSQSETEWAVCISTSGTVAVSSMGYVHTGALSQVVEHLAGSLLFSILLSGTFRASDKLWSFTVKGAKVGFHCKLFFVLRPVFGH